MKNKKRLAVIGSLTIMAVFLAGCVQVKNGHPYGPVYDYLARPGQVVMQWIANFMGGNYGWAIIGLTVIVRLLLLPMMINQQRKSTYQQEKMSYIKPEIDKLQQRNKDAQTQEEKTAISQQIMQVYRDNGVSMTGGIGCLPLLIQFPVFSALYYAIRYSTELQTASFYGINLYHSSLLLAILAFLSYLAQGYLSMIGLPKAQRKTMQTMLIISPVMILFVTMSAPAGLGLYFFVGGLFACLQTGIIDLFRPRIKKQVEAEIKKNPIKISDDPVPATEATSATTPESAAPTSNYQQKAEPTKATQDHKNRQRNAGKQRHH